MSQSSINNTVDYRNMSGNVIPSSEYLIETVVLGSNAASVVFSNLGQWAAVYRHLQIVFTSRATTSGTAADRLWVRLNADAGGNYSDHFLRGNGSAVSSGAQTNTTEMFLGLSVRNGNTAGIFGAGIIDILDAYNTNKNTTVRSLNGYTASDQLISLNSGAWRNTSAITSISIVPEQNNFLAGSRFSLYGVN
jgi:hypothetical protein